jgi:cytochrome c-type biogenesis protein CcmH
MSRAKRLALSVWIAALLLGLALPAVSAQAPTPGIDDEVMRIAKNLYCPVCPGVPLDVCDTQACVQWRGLIREKLSAGESEAQIRQYFVAQYGERVLGAPPPEGFNLSAYLFPALVFGVGGLVLLGTVRAWLKRPVKERAELLTATPAVRVPDAALEHIPPEYAERIARELKARE